MASRRPARRPHHGRTQKFQTVRIVAWRSRDERTHIVEDEDGNKVGRYPTNHAVGVAKVIVVAGELETSPDGGATWHRTGETKYITSHTPFAAYFTIDDFTKHAMDYYGERLR